jgi:hypothetical protein
MASVSKQNFSSATDVRTPPGARVEAVDVGGSKVARFSLQPGWRWSESVKPIANTDSCQFRHVGAVVSGRMGILGADGTELEVGPGDVYVIEPGHDAWIVGDDSFVGYEFDAGTVSDYGR